MCNRIAAAILFGVSALVAGGTTSPSTTYDYGRPEVVVAPSSFVGVHGLAIDAKDRVLAGSVVGNAIHEVGRDSGKASVFIPPLQGQADDIAGIALMLAASAGKFITGQTIVADGGFMIR
jgi:NAD(P)-dependent dehydrogenase (short-subunit alcohol dehydrogenase family)